ncbi:DUF2605 domain-containing protein [Euhalothece natronophila Z-M001]|uniref:DUF2605 domain-containing protein n=1 Tax=Euhalothece natronophila Z-M001 TaxID=522448 RepID=A0A5B8NL29_9CHRO|nr:DUF2605 domain-containing protein [Euhalothece natronophila]QDZ39607.1 DUF2605 domain-containing protein [Euhalothece natronophila Z-M001]
MASESEQQLLKAVLAPLLDDFQYWFSHSREILESQDVAVLSPQEQADLLERVKSAQQEVTASQSLFQATDGTIGLEMSTIAPWHQLVTECWQVAQRNRQYQSGSENS